VDAGGEPIDRCNERWAAPIIADLVHCQLDEHVSKQAQDSARHKQSMANTISGPSYSEGNIEHVVREPEALVIELARSRSRMCWAT
jgi:hypothetical protein